MTDNSKSAWGVLSRIDVADKIEKKNGLSYLSWAWAWGVLKDRFPRAVFVKHCRADGIPYFIDMQGYAFVKVTISLNDADGTAATETFPVLDHRNKPIMGPNAFDVNNALQRCLAKTAAYLGLGHYIYAGEDVPEEAVGAAPEAPKQLEAPAPAQITSAPVAVAGGVPVVTIDGETTSHPMETVAAVFAAFIPLCADERTLSRFYTTNKTAIALLKEREPSMHTAVLAEFSARKAELKKPAEQGEN